MKRDALLKFPGLHLRNLFKRVVYNYFLRGFSPASLSLLVGMVLFFAGGIFGITQWMESARLGVPATAGTVMLSAFPVLLGVQFLLNFLSHDVTASQRPALHPQIARVKVLSARPVQTVLEDKSDAVPLPVRAKRQK